MTGSNGVSSATTASTLWPKQPMRTVEPREGDALTDRGAVGGAGGVAGPQSPSYIHHSSATTITDI
jgi:hypothetical protein